jgi:hypothetical protein
MYAQVFAAGQPQASESLFFLALCFRFCDRDAVFHQSFQLRKSLLDLRDGSRAIDEFAFHGEELEIKDSPMLVSRGG